MGTCEAGMGRYQEVSNFMLCSSKTTGMVCTIKNKQMTVAAAAWNVQQYFIVGSGLSQSAERKNDQLN